MPNIEDELDVAWASQAFKCLVSKDLKAFAMAASRIRDTIKARTTARDPEIKEVMAFLNAQPERNEKCLSRDVRSLYSLMREGATRD